MPQGQSLNNDPQNPGVIPIEEYVGAALLRVVKGKPLLAVLSSLGELSEVVQDLSVHHVGPRETIRILCAPSQGEELLPQLMRRL